MLPKIALLLRAIKLSCATKGSKTPNLRGGTRTNKTQILGALLVALIVLILLSAATGQEKATQQEVIDKVKEAAILLSNTRDEEQFRQKGGRLVWKGTYIFVLDCEKIYAVLHTRPDIRFNLQVTDPKGSSIFPKPEEPCEAATRPDGIWIQYLWVKAGEKRNSTQVGYFLGARGTPYVVGAGIYDNAAAIAKRDSLQSIIRNMKGGLVALGFALGLGLIFLIFHLLGRPLVTGIVFPGSTPLRGKRRQMIGDYTILNELGRGGMGTVFKAISRQGRTVAIKVIGGVGLDRRAGASGRNRVGLVHEARLAASLRHQNIVQIFDVGREEQTLYLVMEYLEGVPLSLYIRNHRPGVLEALRIVAELCDAISYAHGRGVVHRDVKPANIFITTDKTVKVLDFGLAYQGDEVKDSPGLAGTLPYMSPEQFDCRDIDARSDVWSAGITLFEILTGRCPFVGKDLPSFRRRIIDGSLPELPSELPCVYDLTTVLEKALAKNRDARYQTAVAFAGDLRSVISKIEQSTSVRSEIVSPATIHDPALANEPPERTLVPKPATKNLGFGTQFRAEVFVTEPSTKEERFVGGNISGLDGLPGLVVGAAAIALVFVAGYRWSLFTVDGLWFCGALTALMTLVVLGLLCRRAYELVFPPQVLQCRSCQRRMRTASDWRRSVWLVDTAGLGVPDCLTALKENNWEDAVTLFLVHTTAERTDTWARLMFLECKCCLDQRAYFWFPKNQFVPLWSEAYKFFDPRKAQEFAKAEKLRTGITHPISTDNTVDFHDQVTM